MYGMLLIIIVVGISGFIAYLGDQIGMKVGKKRISIFGLRPKYTSVIITILTGVLIAVLTLTVILATNNGVREALFRIQEVQERIKSLEGQSVILEERNKTLEERNDTLQEMNKTLQADKENLEVKSRLARQEFDRYIEQAQEKLDALKIEQERLNQEITALKQTIDSLNQEINSLNQTIEQKNQQINELNGTIRQKNQQISELNETKQQLEEAIVIYNESYKNFHFYYMFEDIVYQKGDIIYSQVFDATRSQEELINALEAFLKKANQEVLQYPVRMVNEKAGTALNIDIDEIFKAAALIQQAGSERVIVRLQAANNVPKNDEVIATFRVLEDFVVFEENEIIESIIIDASKNPAELESDLESLFNQVSARAVKSGLLSERGSVGSIDFSQFYKLLNLIQSHQGMVQVEVLASADIWREDKLSNQNLAFNIQIVDGED